LALAAWCRKPATDVTGALINDSAGVVSVSA
jgi:hypothetical protein